MNDLVQPLSEVMPESIRWLWDKNLSFGNLALFDGDPGLGKSMVALDLCARLTTGRPFPGDSMTAPPASAIVLNAEDSAHNCVRPRLAAMGADVDLVHVLRREWLDDHGGLRLPNHTEALERALADTGARLIVIDPITAFLDKSASHVHEMSVRDTLAPLARMAARYTAVILMIRHLNKLSDTSSIYRGSGSIAFQGICRSSWLFGRDPADRERRIMAQVKNNYAPLQTSLAYEFQTHAEAAAINWVGTSKLSANQLLVAAGLKPDLPGPIERAKEFLLGFLQEGPRPTTDIWPAAQKVGIAHRTLSRARKRAGIRVVRTWTDKKLLSYWLLAGQKLLNQAADTAVPDIQELLKPLIEKYPTTPIDN